LLSFFKKKEDFWVLDGQNSKSLFYNDLKIAKIEIKCFLFSFYQVK